MTDSPIRLMLVGCGVVARRHTAALRNDTRSRWAVFCDPRREAAAALAAEFAPTAAIETDFATALARNACDAVVLCSPNAQHYEQTVAALEKGLDVLCEKPLAVRREHIDDIVARTAASRRIVSIAHQRRYKAAYVTARRELTVNAARYGALRQVHIFTCENWAQTIAGTWRNDPTQNLGYCGDAGIHQVDVTYFVTGRTARRLYAVSDRRGTNVEIVTRIVAELEGGVGLSAHYVGDANHWREDMHFHCERADLLVRNEQLFRAVEGKCEPLTDLEPEGDPATAFVDAVRGGRPTVSPPEIARPIYAWNEAVARSLAAGGWVDVSP